MRKQASKQKQLDLQDFVINKQELHLSPAQLTILSLIETSF